MASFLYSGFVTTNKKGIFFMLYTPQNCGLASVGKILGSPSPRKNVRPDDGRRVELRLGMNCLPAASQCVIDVVEVLEPRRYWWRPL